MWRDAGGKALFDYSNKMMELGTTRRAHPAGTYSPLAARQQRSSMEIQPILCGAALQGMGVQPVLDAVQYYLPSPKDMPPEKGLGIDKKKKDEVIERKASPDEPFSGLVFKVLPAKTGDISWVRIYSGQLKPNSRVLNPGKDVKENVSQLWQIHATKKEQQLELADMPAISLASSVCGNPSTEHDLRPRANRSCIGDPLPGNRHFDGRRTGKLDQAPEKALCVCVGGCSNDRTPRSTSSWGIRARTSSSAAWVNCISKLSRTVCSATSISTSSFISRRLATANRSRMAWKSSANAIGRFLASNAIQQAANPNGTDCQQARSRVLVVR